MNPLEQGRRQEHGRITPFRWNGSTPRTTQHDLWTERDNASFLSNQTGVPQFNAQYINRDIFPNYNQNDKFDSLSYENIQSGLWNANDNSFTPKKFGVPYMTTPPHQLTNYNQNDTMEPPRHLERNPRRVRFLSRIGGDNFHIQN